MHTQTKIVVGILATLLLVMTACDDAPSYTGYLTEEIPPCEPVAGSSVDPCEPDVTITTRASEGTGGASIPSLYDEPFSVRDLLDGGAITFIPHIVLRGTYIPDTVRCTSGNPNREASYEASYVEPGYFQHSILLQCYADVRVNGYILGSGPSRLTVLVDFYHYWHGYFAKVAEQEGVTEEQFVEIVRENYEFTLGGVYAHYNGIYGREVILFIGPAHNPAYEVWEVFETWDVQKREDGTVIAVHPHRDVWKKGTPDRYREHLSVLEVELPRFAQEVAAAQQARVSEYGGRIAPADIQSRAEGVDLPMLITDVHDLSEYLANTGAYDHPDGTPLPPPPVPGEGDPVQDVGVDDSTPEATPEIPGGGEGDSTPPAVP